VPADSRDNFQRNREETNNRATRMNQTDETIHSTSGLRRITGSRPKAKLRLAGLGLTAGLGALLIIGVSRTTWQRVDQLQTEFASLRAESFYLGVRMHSGVRRLNDTLLRYRLKGSDDDYEIFRTDTGELKKWLERNRTNALTALEQEFFAEVGTAYDDYLVESTKVLEASRTRWLSTQAQNFQDSYEKVQQQSQHLLGLCNSFIEDQRAAFDDFLTESKRTLARFAQLLQLSLALLLILAATLVTLVYRGMIAPLRHRLTESEAIIARQEKLASLGVLAAGVAHEIRNPLTAIKFRLFSLKKALPVTDAANEDAAMISNEISRLEKIVKDFLRFARPSEPELVAIPAQRVLQEVYDLLQPQLEKNSIEIKLVPGEPAWVRADTQQIKQVLINLIQNAAESIGQNGQITLRVRREGKREKMVALEVTDTGRGIPPAVQQRLFDPFFTTKEGGTGLGLPIAARIVEKHEGELRYETEPNHGTTFRVVLPRLNEHETKNPVD
jgi:signal transduction histidine kinase